MSLRGAPRRNIRERDGPEVLYGKHLFCQESRTVHTCMVGLHSSGREGGWLTPGLQIAQPGGARADMDQPPWRSLPQHAGRRHCRPAASAPPWPSRDLGAIYAISPRFCCDLNAISVRSRCDLARFATDFEDGASQGGANRGSPSHAQPLVTHYSHAELSDPAPLVGPYAAALTPWLGYSASSGSQQLLSYVAPRIQIINGTGKLIAYSLGRAARPVGTRRLPRAAERLRETAPLQLQRRSPPT